MKRHEIPQTPETNLNHRGHRVHGVSKWGASLCSRCPLWFVFSAAVVLLGFFPAVWLARGAVTPLPPAARDDAPLAAKFVPVDVYLNAGEKKLGAYQLEVNAKDAQIVGLEGGESKAFSAAPYYDPEALQGKRIIVAAFSTDETLPTGDTRVARLHFLATGNVDPTKGMPDMTSKLVVATDADGKTIDAKLTLRPLQGEKP